MMSIKNMNKLSDFPPHKLGGKTALVRCDLNLPLDDDGNITSDIRLQRHLPTLHLLIKHDVKVVIMSHLGRPGGQRVEQLSLSGMADHLSETMDHPVTFVDDLTGYEASATIQGMAPGDVVMLQNLRFDPREKENDPALADELAKLADYYINDAFSTSHRAHASMAGVAEKLPAYAGLALEGELTQLEAHISNPDRPMMAIVGGAKISTKLPILRHLLTRADTIVIGGAMANTLLLAKGYDIGRSLVEESMADAASDFLSAAGETPCNLVLPTDVVTAPELSTGVNTAIQDADSIPADEMALDIGPQTTARVINELADHNTVVWNGPVGAFEISPFHDGSAKIARAIAAQSQSGKITSVTGGGDTLAALEKEGLVNKVTFASTAGGAFLAWLKGEDLPALKRLENTDS
jgi:phosphoglycerate kinase